jgi:hypothetical protein
MSHPPVRGRRVIASLATLGALVFAAPAAAAPFSTACQNSVNDNNTQVNVTEMSATLPTSVQPDTAFGVTNIHGIVEIPGSVFVAGYDLGLIHEGDQINGTLQMILGGTNTTQLSQTSSVFPFTVTVPHITDPNPEPGNQEGESAPDQPVPFQFDDQAWTSGPEADKTMDFSLIPVAKPNKVAGSMKLTASIPTNDPAHPLTVRFGCNPGTVDGESPGTPHYTGTAAPFASSQIKKDAPVVDPPPVDPPPTGGNYTIPNQFTFGKVKKNRKKGTATLPVKVPGAGVLRLLKGSVSGKTDRPTREKTVFFTIKARGKAKRKLNRKGRLKVKLTVSFKPVGGTELTKTKTITLVKKHKKKRKK